MAFWYRRTSVSTMTSIVHDVQLTHYALARFIPFAIFVCSASLLLILAL